MQKNENPVVLSLVLLVIAVVVALLLGFTNLMTKDKIAENTQKEQTLAMQAVLPEAKEFESADYKKDNISAIYKATAGDKFIGWCVNVKSNGYGGEIDLMVGINPDLTLSGVQVVSNSETAGLGAKCTEESFSSQFKGKKAPISVIKNGTAKDDEIVAITGATITSDAVVDGVNAAQKAVADLGGGLNE